MIWSFHKHPGLSWKALETQSWHLNNTALKFIRDSNEDPPGCPQQQIIDLFKDELEIKTLRRGFGEAYELVLPMQPWSWKKMIKAMKTDVRDLAGSTAKLLRP